MHVPFGWVSLVVGVLAAVIYVVKLTRGDETSFTLLASGVGAFVAGWIACVSMPQMERRLGEKRPAADSAGG